MYKSASFTFVFLFLISLNVVSQQKSIIPPSPEVAMLAKYSDVPVSYYTGIPEINIPLYELKCGSLTLPISISYYASGVKVEDISSFIGNGWSLFAGGVVTRTIRGKAEGVLSDGSVYPTVAGLPLTEINPGMNELNKVLAVSEGNAESEPDIFYFNFNGRGGSFYFNAAGKPILKKAEDIKIEYLYVGPGVSKFKFTLEDGTKYYFDLPDKTGTTVDINSWYLTKIEDVNSVYTINFNYEAESYWVGHIARATKSYYFAHQSSSGGYLAAYYDPLCNREFVSNKRLTSIVTSLNDSIVLKARTEPRKDVSTSDARPLDEMIVKSSLGRIIKRYSFDSRYINSILPFTTPVVGYMCSDPSETYLNTRLYLENLKDITDQATILTYAFKYNGRTPDGRDSLPHRVSPAQDFSGYYNGHTENMDLIPTFDDVLRPDIPSSPCVKGYGYYPTGRIIFPGANRFQDIRYKKMGTLAAITYPTGGRVTFDYGTAQPLENGFTLGGLRIEHVNYLDADGAIIKKKHYEYQHQLPGYNPVFFSYSYYDVEKDILSPFPFCIVGSNPETNYCVTLQINAGPLNDLGMYEGPEMGYEQVKEIEEGNGRTEYLYTSDEAGTGESNNLDCIGYVSIGSQAHHFTFSDYANTWPFTTRNDISWRRGILLKKTVFSEAGQRLTQTENSYTFQELSTIPGLKVVPVRGRSIYVYRQVKYHDGWIKLNNTVETTYEGTAELKRSTAYEYTAPLHKQLTKRIQSVSNGVKRIDRYKYPPDYQAPANSVYKIMQDKHVYSEKIEEISLVNADGIEKQTGGRINLFTYTNGLLSPSQELASIATTPFVPVESSINASTGNLQYHNSYAPVMIYDKYDNRNNLVQLHRAYDYNKIYLWGYNQSLPVAEVINATPDQVFHTSFEVEGTEEKNASGMLLAKTGKKVLKAGNYTIPATFTAPAGVIYKMSYWYYSGNKWLFSGVMNFSRNIVSGGTMLDEIRVYPQEAAMTTYTYEPLVGMLSVCSPESQIIYYDYDPQGRLAAERNSNREIIKNYTYHIK